jgi:hypothetical protein
MADAITLDWAGRSNVDAAVKHQKLQNYEVPDLVRVSDLNEICRTVGLNQKYQGINVGHTANVEEEFGFAYTPPFAAAAAAGTSGGASAASNSSSALPAGSVQIPPRPEHAYMIQEVDDGIHLNEDCFDSGWQERTTAAAAASATYRGRRLPHSGTLSEVPAAIRTRPPPFAGRAPQGSHQQPPAAVNAPNVAGATSAAAATPAPPAATAAVLNAPNVAGATSAAAATPAPPAATAAAAATPATTTAGAAPSLAAETTTLGADGGMPPPFQQVGKLRSKHGHRLSTAFDVARPVAHPEEQALLELLIGLDIQKQLPHVIHMLEASPAATATKEPQQQHMTVSELLVRAETAVRRHSYTQREHAQLHNKPDFENICGVWNALLAFDRKKGKDSCLPSCISPKRTKQLADAARQAAGLHAANELHVQLQGIHPAEDTTRAFAALPAGGPAVLPATAAAALVPANAAAAVNPSAIILQGLPDAIGDAAGSSVAVATPAALPNPPAALAALMAGAKRLAQDEPHCETARKGARGPSVGTKYKQVKTCGGCLETGHTKRGCPDRCEVCTGPERNAVIVTHKVNEQCPRDPGYKTKRQQQQQQQQQQQ